MDERHELFEELEAFDAKWQERYRTLERAAKAAGVLVYGLYRQWLVTDEGARYTEAMRGVKDSLAEQEAYRRTLEAAGIRASWHSAYVDNYEEDET